MEQIGQIVEVSGDKAKVLVRRHDVCSKCGGCGISLSGKGENYMDALNTVNAAVGQTVRVTSDTGQVLKASFVVYIVPVLFLLAGIALGRQLGGEPAGLITGVIFLLLSYLLVRAYDRKVARGRVQSAVVEILEEPAVPADEKC
jgi:sigma-E factor negative regulatory protein RseC